MYSHEFNVGDTVYTPVHYGVAVGWQPQETTIEAVISGSSGYFYRVKLQFFDYDGRKFEKTKEIHERDILKTFEECKEWIKRKYTDSLCDGCPYEFFDDGKYYCKYCKNYRKEAHCMSNRGILCGNYKCKESSDCYNFDNYIDFLKNCIHNVDCDYRIGGGALKTMSFDKFTEKFYSIGTEPFEYNGRTVCRVTVKIKDWFDNSWKNGDVIEKCYGFGFAPLYTETGRTKKGTCNQGVSFEQPVRVKIGVGLID